MSLTLYHLTHPERVREILREGFNDNKVSQSHSIHDDPQWYRTFLTRRRNLAKWLRILGRENGWPTLAILEISVPKETWDLHQVACVEDWKDKAIFFMDWGDQIVLQSRKPVKCGNAGIKIRVLKTIVNPYSLGKTVTLRNLSEFIGPKNRGEN